MTRDRPDAFQLLQLTATKCRGPQRFENGIPPIPDFGIISSHWDILQLQFWGIPHGIAWLTLIEFRGTETIEFSINYKSLQNTLKLDCGPKSKVLIPGPFLYELWKNAGRSSKICRWVSGKVVPRLGYTWGQHLRRGHSDGSQGEVLTWGFP